MDKKYCILFVLILTTIGFVTQGTTQNTADGEAGRVPSPNYFEQVTLFSDGRITRFTHTPIRVHISPTLQALPYLAEIRYAMQTWETVSNGKIQFQETEVLEQADIHVTPTYSGRLGFLDTELGSAKLVWLKDSQQQLIISNQQEVSVVENRTQSPHSLFNPKPKTESQFTVEVMLVLEGDGTTGELTQEEMRTVCLHEFAHAIGLWGHSRDPLDVCHATATAQHPTARDIQTLLKLYDTPLHTPQHETAIHLLKKDIQTNPRQARLHYLLGAVYFDKGDIALAIASFKNCLGVDPNFEPARGKLIQAYEKTGQSNQVIRLIEQRVQSPQGHTSFRERADAYNRLGSLYYQQGDVDKAIQAFENALERLPHHTAARRNLHRLLRQKAFNALKANAFDAAAAYFEKAIHLEPLNATTYRLMGDGYAHVSQFSKAITYYQKALEIDPDDKMTKESLVHGYNNHGVTLRNNGEWDQAIRAYRNALALQPTYQLASTNLIDALWQKANAHRQAGRSSEAITTYLELQKLQPEDTNITNLIGASYLKAQEYPAGIAAFHKVHTALPTDKQARRNLIAAYLQYAQALRDQKAYTEASIQLQKALDLFPTDINLRLILSQVYQQVGKYDQAREELARILEQEPDHKNAKTELVNLQIRRGNALMNRKKYAEAIAAFEAIPASEKTIDMYNMIGYLYLEQNEHLKALATFETVLTQQPQNRVAYQNLRSLESQLDVMVSKMSEASLAEPGTDGKTPNADTIPAPLDPTAEKLSRVRCVLTHCLMNRGQPKNAMEKYRQALEAKPYTPALQGLLIDTGRRLANQFHKQNDLERYETIIRWTTELDRNFKELLEP